jgi:hypothetical protein
MGSLQITGWCRRTTTTWRSGRSPPCSQVPLACTSGAAPEQLETVGSSNRQIGPPSRDGSGSRPAPARMIGRRPLGRHAEGRVDGDQPSRRGRSPPPGSARARMGRSKAPFASTLRILRRHAAHSSARLARGRSFVRGRSRPIAPGSARSPPRALAADGRGPQLHHHHPAAVVRQAAVAGVDPASAAVSTQRGVAGAGDIRPPRRCRDRDGARAAASASVMPRLPRVASTKRASRLQRLGASAHRLVAFRSATVASTPGG